MQGHTNEPFQGMDADQHNTASFLRFGALFALAFFFASTAPNDLVVASLSSLLFLGALGTVLVAVVTGQVVRAPHLTRWDEAAALMALSVLSGWFVDEVAVRQALESAQGLG